MSKPKEHFMTGLFVIAAAVIAGIIIGLVFIVPELLLIILGSPFWMLILWAIIGIPIAIIILGWSYAKIGFKRAGFLPRIQFTKWYVPGPLVRPR